MTPRTSATLFASLAAIVLAAAPAGADKKPTPPAPPTSPPVVDPATPDTAIPIAPDELFVRRVLPASAIAAVVAPWMPDLRACWMRHAADQPLASGEVRLELIIHPEGHVWHKRVIAPGVRGKQFERCVLGVIDRWRFPDREGYTTTEVPFRFQRTRAPGAGPIPGCWSRAGCPRPHPPTRAR